MEVILVTVFVPRALSWLSAVPLAAAVLAGVPVTPSAAGGRAVLAGRAQRRPDEVVVSMLLDPGPGRIQILSADAFDATVAWLPRLT